ncbi:FkbM family methyltransferase [Algiphilus sp.]|uniref:FkbM family methyltransferase n=1 Tax=Algiphilus sp. TaxID=1872431 RepID=UPI003C7E98CC
MQNWKKITKFIEILTVGKFRKQLLLKGVAAGVEHIPVLRSIKPIDFVVDVGANRGQFSIAARYIFPEARFIYFEPISFAAEKLKSTLSDQGGKIDVHEVALGSTRQTSKLHLSRREDSSSLLSIGSVQEEIFQGTEEVGFKEVSEAPLSDFISAGDFQERGDALLKIDVQGYELEVLRGCAKLISYFKWVYIECSYVELYVNQSLASEVIDWLSERDFLLSGVYNTYYDRSGRAIQSDLLFRNSK